MKQWNKDGEPEAFSDLVDGLYDALMKALSMREGVYQHGLPYDGYEVGGAVHHVNYTAEERFEADNLRIEKEDHGRDVFNVILSTAVHLGIEQGKRAYFQEIKDKLEIGETMAGGLSDIMSQLRKSGGKIED